MLEFYAAAADVCGAGADAGAGGCPAGGRGGGGGGPGLEDHVGGLLADHDAGRVGVAVDDDGHDGGVGDAQAVDAVDAEPGVDDGRGVGGRPHLARAHRVVHGHRQVVDEAQPIGVRVVLVVAAGREGRGHQRHAHGPHGRRVDDALRHADALQQDAGVAVGRQVARVDDGSVGRIGRAQPDSAAALGPRQRHHDRRRVAVRRRPVVLVPHAGRHVQVVLGQNLDSDQKPVTKRLVVDDVPMTHPSVGRQREGRLRQLDVGPVGALRPVGRQEGDALAADRRQHAAVTHGKVPQRLATRSTSSFQAVASESLTWKLSGSAKLAVLSLCTRGP